MHLLTKSPIDCSIFGSGSGGAPWTPAQANPQLWSLDNTKHRSGLVTGWDGVSRKVLESNEAYGTYRAPEPGRCYQFDGTNDYISVPNLGQYLLGDLTYFCEVNLTVEPSSNRWHGLISVGSTSSLYSRRDLFVGDKEVNNGLIWWNGDSGIYGASSLLVRVWYKVGVTYVATTRFAKLWINGAVDGSGAWGNAQAFPIPDDLEIGQSSHGSSWANVRMRNIQIWSRALSDAEMVDVFNGVEVISGRLVKLHGTEGDGTTAYDSSGNSNHGTITNATLSTFHATDSSITNNDANIRGYSLSGNARVPAINDTTDALGNPLQFTGKCPHPVAVETPGITNHDGTVYLSAPHLTGSETVTSYEGTGVPTVTAGRIGWPSGTTISQIVLSDGTHYVAQEGPGTSNTNRTVYDVSSGGNHATLISGTVATIWGTRILTAADHCIEYGGRIGAEGEFVPGLLSGSSAADGNAITLTAGKHGNPFSRLTWNPFEAAEFNGRSLPTAYAPGDVLAVTPADSAFRRTKADGDDRLLVFEDALTGNDLTEAQNYTA